MVPLIVLLELYYAQMLIQILVSKAGNRLSKTGHTLTYLLDLTWPSMSNE